MLTRRMARGAAAPARAKCSSARRCAPGWTIWPPMPESPGEIEQFLYLEARLLDTQRYEEWLDLDTENATYWVPPEQDQREPFATSSNIYDDRTLLGLPATKARPPPAHA